jgi:hypothetical protein
MTPFAGLRIRASPTAAEFATPTLATIARHHRRESATNAQVVVEDDAPQPQRPYKRPRLADVWGLNARRDEGLAEPVWAAASAAHARARA